MNVKQIKQDLNYMLNFGMYTTIVEFDQFGIDKDIDKLFETIADSNIVIFKGETDTAELNKLINKLYKHNPAIEVFYEFSPVKTLKFKGDVVFNLMINEDYQYDYDVLEFYTKRKAKFIVTKAYAQQFQNQYNIPKHKIVIIFEELTDENIAFCRVNKFNFAYDFSILGDG